MPDRPSPSRGSLFERVGGVLPRGAGQDKSIDYAAKVTAEELATQILAADDADRKRKKELNNVLRQRPGHRLSDIQRAIRRGRKKGRRRKAAEALTTRQAAIVEVRRRKKVAAKTRRTNG
jgi:hypothetical protein